MPCAAFRRSKRDARRVQAEPAGHAVARDQMWVTRRVSTGARPKTFACARGTCLAQPRRVLWLRPWVIFSGGALAVVLLDWAEPVLMPVAVSLLLTFLLNPPVNSLQRWIGRGSAVVIVVSLTFVVLTLLGWVLARQVTSLADDLPGYRQNIRQKVADIRALSRGGPVAQVQSTLEDIKQEMAQETASVTNSRGRLNRSSSPSRWPVSRFPPGSRACGHPSARPASSSCSSFSCCSSNGTCATASSR